MLDYIRIACAVPAVKVGDVKANADQICAYMEKAELENVDILLFPELALTGYTCGDLFFQDQLIISVEQEMKRILEKSQSYPQLTAVVGFPLRQGMGLLNCAALIRCGKIRGITAKRFLSDSAGIDEGRWFDTLEESTEINFCGQNVSLGGYPIYDVAGAKIGIEICEDLFSPVSPSTCLAVNGAEVILNPAASVALPGNKQERRDLVKVQSRSCRCIYAFCSAGSTESTSDAVYSGHSIVVQNGQVLCESSGIAAEQYMLVQDCDLGVLRSARRHSPSIRRCAGSMGGIAQTVDVGLEELRSDGSLYPLEKMPFVPAGTDERNRYCEELFQLQVMGLSRRLTAIGDAKAVIGISGGLDSTLALLVAVETMRQLGRPITDVHGVTMPCYGTSDRTYQNAWELMRRLGITTKEVVIKNAVSQHFQDIGHDPSVRNATYENSQARERTQILMDYASVVGGIVVGTGDLSELALGWCTYNGDHMSMYGVNAAVPKTLIQWVVDAVSQKEAFLGCRDILLDILDTPISPELLPPDAVGKISQQTEDLVGPYILHDFFIYHAIANGFSPKKIYIMACRAFAGIFDAATVKKWLKSFYRRFFTQQFKRNCMPDGAKVTEISFSPRGSWQMPSDACSRIWAEEADVL